MSNTLNYTLKFRSDADKVTASVLKLDKGLDKVQSRIGKLTTKFSTGIDKINSKLGGLRLNSFIQNIQFASQGLDSMNAPGLKLNASLADLSAITDVTGDGLKQIERYARDNAKTFGGEAADGVESYKLILSQLNPEIAKAPKALQNMGNHVSTLSKTMGGDATAATEVLTTAMNQYQISTDDPIKASEQMGIMMNIMAAGAKEGSAELPQIKTALENAGLAAKTANVSFSETNGYIQVLDKAGKKGAEGGVALRNVMASLAQGRFLPKDVQKELASAGISISDLTDKNKSLSDRLKPLRGIMHDQALITKMFGKENSNAAIAMISGIDEAERLTTAITGTNTAYEQAAIVMDSQAEKNSRLKARVDDFKISLFNATGGLMGYASVLGSLAFDISNLIPIFSGFGQMISFVTNASKMQALWSGIVSTATTVWTGVQWLLNAALTANPIGLIVVGVAALIAVIAHVISKTEGWGKAWKHTVNGAKLLFIAFGNAIKLHFMIQIQAIMVGINMIKLGWYKFKEAVGLGDSSENQNMISKIKADTERRKQAIIDQAKKVAETALKAKDEFQKAAGSIKWKVKTEVETPTGITAPSLPGVTNSEKTPTKDGNKDPLKTNKSIATGGTKHNYITINLDKLIEAVNIKGNDFKDSAKQMQDQTTDALLRTLALATTAGS
ncbi:phage tail tape measure protein [bacterium]|nr:phage tail tape measure protein [bacterium]